MSPAKQSTQTTGMQHWVCRIHCSIAVILALAFPDNHNVAAQDFPTPTLSYQTPAKLTVGDAPIDLKDHVTTRFFDWDQDSDLDLLAGGGDGRLWLFQNIGTTKLARFKSKQPILAGNRDRWGDSYTGVLLTNLVGNPLADLVVCHSVFGKMEQWSFAWKLDAHPIGHRILANNGLSLMQLPRGVVNFASENLPLTVCGVKTIPRGQELFQ